MKQSLYYKFILGYLIFGFLGFSAVSIVSSKLIYDHVLEERTEMMYDEASLIANAYSSVYQGKKQTMSAITPQLQLAATTLNADVWVVNRQGMIVVDQNLSARQGTTIEEFDPTAMGNKSYLVGNYYGSYPYEVVTVSAPITGNYHTYGYVLIHLPVSQIWAESNDILDIVYISSAIIFALSLIILLVFGYTVYVPVKKITEGAKEYAQGHFNHQIAVDSHDEMGYLAATLNYMSDEMNKMEEYQRRFIANVSHDFRSPLTSIKGYLEAIIDGTIPPELYEKYINRVITETERLTKLTEGLLTLNSMDSKGYLTRTKFDLNQVIKDTAALFEGTCEKKNMMFDLTFVNEVEMVYADIGKIQQVLYNLIDNAIKFSHADSVIYIKTNVKNEKLFVSVKDSGIGIPKESLKKIWDRFYKTDLSRGKDKKGSGLGLAIVKEVIQAHGETIDVISTEGVGTEFVFSLSRAGAQNRIGTQRQETT